MVVYVPVNSTLLEPSILMNYDRYIYMLLIIIQVISLHDVLIYYHWHRYVFGVAFYS